jgi:predicted lipid-binding transport protein (Tim44 family)
VAKRRLTIKRLDPWSVLKFSILAHIVGFAITMLIAGVVYYIIDQLQLIDQACGIAADVGFTSCGINTGNLFRALTLLGGMGVIVFTAVSVFIAFLYNLIADLTGGLTIGIVDDSPPTRQVRPAGSATSGSIPMDRAVHTGRTTAAGPPARPDRTTADAPAPDATREQQPVGRRPPAEGDELFGHD